MNGLCWEKYFAPQLWGNGLVAWDARFTLKEIWYKRKTNPFDSFHNFEEVKKALLNFGALFQWVVGHLSEKMLQWSNVYIRGRANLVFPARLKPQKWLYLANTFLAPPPRGVAALVSVSDDKIQITILILRRGALSTFSWQSQKDEQVLGSFSAGHRDVAWATAARGVPLSSAYPTAPGSHPSFRLPSR